MRLQEVFDQHLGREATGSQFGGGLGDGELVGFEHSGHLGVILPAHCGRFPAGGHDCGEVHQSLGVLLQDFR